MLFLIILSISGFTLGLHAVSLKGRILHGLRVWLEKKLPAWATKPVISCAICTTSVWGTIVYFSFANLSSPSLTVAHWVLWPLACISASFVNHFVLAILELVSETIKSLKIKNRVMIRSYSNIPFNDIDND